MTIEEEFNIFWSMYPIKEDKKKCLAKYKKINNSYAVFRNMFSYVSSVYYDHCEGFKRRYKNPLTFLNGVDTEVEGALSDTSFLLGEIKEKINACKNLSSPKYVGKGYL